MLTSKQLPLVLSLLAVVVAGISLSRSRSSSTADEVRDEVKGEVVALKKELQVVRARVQRQVLAGAGNANDRVGQQRQPRVPGSTEPSVATEQALVADESTESSLRGAGEAGLGLANHRQVATDPVCFGIG